MDRSIKSAAIKAAATRFGKSKQLLNTFKTNMELTDKQLSERLIGTWVTSPLSNPDVVSTATYNADGSGTEVVELRSGERKHNIQIDLYWSVADGVLTTRSIGSSDLARVPVGLQLKDHILSLSDDKFISRSGAEYGIGEGEEIVKVRVG